MSSSQIGKAIGKSKGSVCGFFFRSGIKLEPSERQHRLEKNGREARARLDRANGYVRMKSVSRRGVRAEPQHMREPDIGIFEGVGVKIWALEASHCKWVVGEPKDLTCCGNARQNGSPYCGDHHNIAFKPREG